MLRLIRGALLGNWRNKGVALFFAVTIWFVAYQSELQTEDVRIDFVLLTPKQAGKIIIAAEERQRSGEMAPFSGRVTMSVNGPRKQIDEFRKAIPTRIEVLVDAAADPESPRKKYFFRPEDMTLPKSPVEIVGFEPASVDLVFDEREEREVPVTTYVPVKEGWEKIVDKVEPEKMQVSGPRSILDRIRLVAEPPSFDTERFEGTVPVQLRHENPENTAFRRMVTFLDRPEVKLTVQLRIRQREFSRENVKVRFVVPALKFPYRIDFDESTIPVRFLGPEREIQRLEARISEDPGFFVAVEVPEYDLSPERQYSFTFSEEKLRIFGFSTEIQKLQHESRKGKGPWQCAIVPVNPQAAGETR